MCIFIYLNVSILCWFLPFNNAINLIIYVSPPFLTSRLSHPIPSSRSSESTRLGSLRYTATFPQLSILSIDMYICWCYSVRSFYLLSPSPTVSSPFSTSVSPFLPSNRLIHTFFFLRFHIYALITYSLTFYFLLNQQTTWWPGLSWLRSFLVPSLQKDRYKALGNLVKTMLLHCFPRYKILNSRKRMNLKTFCKFYILNKNSKYDDY